MAIPASTPIVVSDVIVRIGSSGPNVGHSPPRFPSITYGIGTLSVTVCNWSNHCERVDFEDAEALAEARREIEWLRKYWVIPLAEPEPQPPPDFTAPARGVIAVVAFVGLVVVLVNVRQRRRAWRWDFS